MTQPANTDRNLFAALRDAFPADLDGTALDLEKQACSDGIEQLEAGERVAIDAEHVARAALARVDTSDEAAQAREEMEAAIAASFPLIEAKQSPSLIGWLEHQGEHYGKLVTAYRVNGIVPPVSRPKQ